MTEQTELTTYEARDASPSRAPERKPVAMKVREAIEAQSQAFRTVLPDHVSPDRYARLVLSAVKATPDLMGCFQTDQGTTSVLMAAMQCATIGLEPNTPLQEAWLLPRKNKGTVECQLSIGYRGYLKLARRSGTLREIHAQGVREGDTFHHGFGHDGPTLDWTPAPDEQRGELTHAFAVAWFMNGGRAQMVLNRVEVEARRAKSDSWRNDKARPYSPWTTTPEAMWRKSAIRALVPYLDLAPEAERAFASDERSFAFDDDAGVLEITSGFDDDQEDGK